VKRVHEGGRCSVLLVSLVILILGWPYLNDLPAGRVFLSIAGTFVPLAGIYAVSTRTRTRAIALILALPILVDEWAAVEHGSTAAIVYTATSVVFYGFTAVVILRYVLGGRTVTADKLAGAVSAYLLMGIAFAGLYSVMEQVTPGSLLHSNYPEDPVTYREVLYFSLVTLTTLGYGDIVPVTEKARTLAMVESALGVMYSAVLVAQLVGASVSGPRKE
jgi:hypothetical protein